MGVGTSVDNEWEWKERQHKGFWIGEKMPWFLLWLSRSTERMGMTRSAEEVPCIIVMDRSVVL